MRRQCNLELSPLCRLLGHAAVLVLLACLLLGESGRVAIAQTLTQFGLAGAYTTPNNIYSFVSPTVSPNSSGSMLLLQNSTNGTTYDVTVTGVGGSNFTAPIDGAVNAYGLSVQGAGNQASPNQWGSMLGPSLNLTSSATLFANTQTTPLPSGDSWPGGTLPSTINSSGALNAISYGAAAYSGNVTGGGGGAVAITQKAGTLTAGAPAQKDWAPSGLPWSPWLSGLYAGSTGGQGFQAQWQSDSAGAGDGGAGGSVNITTSILSVVDILGTSAGSASGQVALNGITAISAGAANGFYCDDKCGKDTPYYRLGVPGTGGPVTVVHAGSITSSGTYGSLVSGSIGISAISLGGSLAAPSGSWQTTDSSASLYAGNAGNVSVHLGQLSKITLLQGNAIGVLAASGAGDVAPSARSQGGSNSAGSVSVTLEPGAQVTVGNSQSIYSAGVLAISAGSSAVLAPFSQNTLAAGGFAAPGAVTVSNGGSISSTGTLAVGIGALSIGGGGIATQTSGSAVNYLGSTYAGNSIGGSLVTVSNTGSITTDGGSAFGIVALAGAAGGLVAADASAVFTGSTLSSGLVLGNSSGNTIGSPGGGITVNNSGTIVTGDANGGGNMAIGIVAQSIGGGGGSSGGNGAAAFVGDAGGAGGNGGTTTVNMAGGSISTQNDGAIGILAQSIGGGGGNGGNAKGLYVAVGGRGGSGGVGGPVFVNQTGGSIVSSGDFAAGVLAQSVGGGGGNGGYAKAAGLVYANAIGGAGGSGGNGDSVSFSQNWGSITTAGQGSAAVLLQSVGGGGGNGGAALAHSAGLLFSEAVSVGGGGGSGGIGGTVTVTGCASCQASNPDISTSGPDSIGILAQSIGGGGGNGGAALAKSLAIAGDSKELPTISASFSLGGSGGSGGNGGAVTINNWNGLISTSNDGSNAILAQSIGGGGGNGADSTAAANATNGNSLFTLQISTAIGGSGGSGGAGGSVTVGNGQAGYSTMLLQTLGANAPGIVAQSVGGGGGNGGGGNASVNTLTTCLQNCAATTIQLDAAVGGKGGSGNIGGVVQVTNASNGSIFTQGSGSPAILAQSIGGGGGTAGGGATAGAGAMVNVNVAVGGSGGTGNYAQPVTVTNQGSIVTGAIQPGGLVTGGDSVGILAQSIGGGGGAGGSSDAAAIVGTGIVAQVTNAFNPPPPPASYNANVTVGGFGGSGNFGNTVTITNSGSILTYGTRAYGIEAQSIGAGGGNGGEASSSNAGESGSVNLNLAGGGGGSGNGGTVSVSNSGTISTLGYAATGILAQSIGGGGGVGGSASTSSASTIGVGLNVNGTNPSSGYGYQVTVTHSGSISTQGDDAYGMLAQSLGGGGGMVSAGCSNSLNARRAGLGATGCFGNTGVTGGVGLSGPLTAAPFAPNYSLNVSMGGLASSNDGAYGGSATVDLTGNAAITTYGARSFGLVVQSIGGGGGILTSAATNLSATMTNNPGQNDAKGGSVTINLAAGTSVVTSGAGAWGVVAQSIGAGGGLVGDPSLPLTTPVSNTLANLNGSNGADGGAIGITSAGNITTTGINAHGIVVQSIGGGGGMAAGAANNPNMTVVLGNSGQFHPSSSTPTYSGQGGAITIDQTGGTISTSGMGSIGIIAQSSGNSSYMSPIQITIGGQVIGGSATGAAGILVSCGEATNNGHGYTPNTITVNFGGSVNTQIGTSGTAIIANSGITNVTNNGTLTGAVVLGASSASAGDMTNNGTWNSGTVTSVVAALMNNGLINVGGAGTIGSSTLVGDFTQTPNGRLAVDVNSLANQLADRLIINGNATIGGILTTNATALLPGSFPILSATGNLAVTASPASSLLFNWATSTAGNTLFLAPAANFTPAGLPLSSSQESLARYLQRAWNAADPFLARSFGGLSHVQNPTAYATILNANRPGAILAQNNNLAQSGTKLLGSALSCPVFIGDGTLLGEESCVWARFIGGQANQYAGGGDAGSRVEATVYRLGTQREVAPGWFLGGSLGAGNNWSSSASSSSTGQIFDGSVAVKFVSGNWLLAASAGAASGSFQNTRLNNLAGLTAGAIASGALTSDSSALQAAGRLRAAYEVAYSEVYLRPYADLDLIHTHTPGFHEAGTAGWPLAYSAVNQTNLVFSPMVQLGVRYDLDAGQTLRGYLDLGASFQSKNHWVSNASIVGAAAADGGFQNSTAATPVVGRFNLGVQLYQRGGWEVRAEYGLEFANQYLGQFGSGRLAYHF